MALLAKGTRLYADPLGGTSYAEIAGVKELDPKYNTTRKVVDVTPLTPSTDENEVMPGLAEKGKMSFKCFHTAARELVLRTPYLAAISVGWKRTFSDNANPASATKDTFTGFITMLTTEGTGAADDPVLLVCEVQVDSIVTRA